MKLRQLVEIASAAYTEKNILPDLTEYFRLDGTLKDRAGRALGDTLGEFIASELHDTFDEEADDDTQFEEAIAAISFATEQLEKVVNALVSARSKVRRKRIKEAPSSQTAEAE